MKQKSLKKNTIFSAIKTLSSILFPLITFPYISRVLLTENVGKINFGLSIVSYFSLLASLGIAVHKYNKNHDEANRVNIEIYLTDDGCTDGTAERMQAIVDYCPLNITNCQ